MEVPHFSAPVLAVHLNGERKGLIAYAPHRLDLGTLGKGTHELEITAYGNRYNAFGTLHNANDEYQWYGPDSYRTTGSQWTIPTLRAMGVLSAPVHVMFRLDSRKGVLFHMAYFDLLPGTRGR